MRHQRGKAARVLAAGLAIGIATGVLACGGSSPTAPGRSGSNGEGLTIVFNDASGALADRQAIIRGHIEDTFELAVQQISIDGIDVTVDANRNRMIPFWGVGGRSPNGSTVELSVDPDLLLEDLAARLPSMVAHELHHVARHRDPGYGKTLLKAMVSEGLADHYAQELYGEPLPPWTVALTAAEMEAWMERARTKFDSKGYSHSEWFFGSGPEIPRWTGYTLGYKLVADYKAAHPGATAVSLVNADADLFRPGG